MVLADMFALKHHLLKGVGLARLLLFAKRSLLQAVVQTIAQFKQKLA